MKKPLILLIEDEEDIASLISLQAKIAGYDIHVEKDGLDGFLAVQKTPPDLVLLDLMLPGLNGLDVCRKMKARKETKTIPIIMISAKSEETDVIAGLELGADDYVTKPFSPKILFSRIGAVLRRHLEPKEASNTFSFGPFSFDVERYILKKEGSPITLTLSEFGILKRLVNSRSKVLTRNQLLDEIQEEGAFIVDRNIDVHIASLRKKLGPNFTFIETVRGVGYRFVE